MQLSIAATLLACAAGQAHAFSDSSPFILFSSAELPPASTTAQLQTSAQVLDSAKALLASCPTTRYLLVSQPNLHAADIRDDGSSSVGDGCRMPNLCRAIQGESHVYGVAEVIGQVSGQPLAEYIEGVCGEKGTEVRVERVEMKHLPAVSTGEERAGVLADNDHELGHLLETLEGDYTVVMFSDPNEFKPYEPEFAEPVHMDMRRWAEPEVVTGAKSNSTRDNRPLFEKYQFFTPGVFMALITLIILLSILGAGLKALSSLEVSYGAFDKEMGPAAQKKQM